MPTTSQDLFEILAREHAPSLTAYLRAVVKDGSAVDDLFQETMLAAWRNIDTFDRSRPFGPWLRGIAAKQVLAHYRKSSKNCVYCDEVVLEQLEARLETIHRQTGDTFEEKIAGLRECMSRLPPNYRHAITARYSEGYKGQSLADHLHLSLENVKKRLQRGRQLLAECLERKWIAEANAP